MIHGGLGQARAFGTEEQGWFGRWLDVLDVGGTGGGERGDGEAGGRDGGEAREPVGVGDFGEGDVQDVADADADGFAIERIAAAGAHDDGGVITSQRGDVAEDAAHVVVVGDAFENGEAGGGGGEFVEGGFGQAMASSEDAAVEGKADDFVHEIA